MIFFTIVCDLFNLPIAETGAHGLAFYHYHHHVHDLLDFSNSSNIRSNPKALIFPALPILENFKL